MIVTVAVINKATHKVYQLADDLDFEARVWRTGCRAVARQVVLFRHHSDRTDDELDKITQRFAGAQSRSQWRRGVGH